jgi:hypothetical protein
MQKINWTDRVRNRQVLHRVKKERNILQTIKGWKANWIGHIWSKNAFWNMLLRKDRRKDRNYGKSRKKTEEATG